MVKYLTKKEVMLPKRSSAAHKSDSGRVLVIGGSMDYIGAVLLAGLAAYRAGADLVTVIAPEKVAFAINTFSLDLITKKVPGNYFSSSSAKKVVKFSKDYDVALIGNGVGQEPSTKKFVREVVKGIKIPKVIDADAIKAVSLKHVKNSILTPHQAEFQQLLANSKLTKSKLSKHLDNNVILLKGKVDEIITAKKTFYNKTGNPGMTIGGTGDVLAGLAAGILAQQKDLIKASCTAAFVSGEIGDKLFRKRGIGFLASEMLDLIPVTLKQFRK